MAKTYSGPVHPGEMLVEEFLKPLGIRRGALARALGVSCRRINALANGRRPVTADMALGLGRYFGTGAPWWMNMQADYDRRVAGRATAGEGTAPPRRGCHERA